MEMKPSKTYEDELEDLESALMRLEKMVPIGYLNLIKINQAIEIQKTRIQSFKHGYSLKSKEEEEQLRIVLDFVEDPFDEKLQNKLFPSVVGE